LEAVEPPPTKYRENTGWMKERKTTWAPLRDLLAITFILGGVFIPKLGKSEPESQDELEGVIEWEPVHSADQALKDAGFELVMIA
jgi:hypothetical protein